MKGTKYVIRFVSRIILEAQTPLAVGSGKKSLLTDAVVATDINGLPFIPATSLAGVIRSACGLKDDSSNPFGYQSKDSGEGSRVIFSDGVMMGNEGTPVDGPTVINYEDDFYSHFKTLPIRQHVHINDKGCTDNGGKFDEQVVYQGTRFCFEMEFLSEGSDSDRQFYEKMLCTLSSNIFRVGGGTRNGFGLMSVKSLRYREYDLTNPTDLNSYANRSASLKEPLTGAVERAIPVTKDNKWKHYTLELKPDDFFLFGSGLGDDEADITPVSEGYINWDNQGKPSFHEGGVLVPATSVKGALAHRTAYHWNKLKGAYADDKDKQPLVNDQNPAVKAIFGSSGKNEDKEIKRGNILLSDIILPAHQEKILNHVALDRFTGGSMDGALFTEKVTHGQDLTLKLHIDVLGSCFKDGIIQQAFELSLEDIAQGLLPLGGGVNRGNGIFTGTLIKEKS